MNPDDLDWKEIITRTILQQTGGSVTRDQLDQVVSELRAARDDPDDRGLSAVLNAMGVGQLDTPETRQFLSETLERAVLHLEQAFPEDIQPGPPADPGKQDLLLSARTLLGAFLVPGADLQRLGAGLRPRPGDYALAFEQAYAAVAQQAYELIWERPDVFPAPKPGQSGLLLSLATAEQIKTEGAPRAFPGGFGRIAHTLRDGTTWGCWKFVRPRQRTGMAFHGLAWLDDHWAWFPKPWRVLGNIDA